MVETETAQRDVTEGRVDVAVDEPRVPVGGGRSDLSPLARQPGLGEELSDGDRSSGLWWWHVAFGCESGRQGFGLATVVAGGVPSSTFSAGEWVEAVVGDDVEAVLALDDVAHGVSVNCFDANQKGWMVASVTEGRMPASRPTGRRVQSASFEPDRGVMPWRSASVIVLRNAREVGALGRMLSAPWKRPGRTSSSQVTPARRRRAA